MRKDLSKHKQTSTHAEDMSLHHIRIYQQHILIIFGYTKIPIKKCIFAYVLTCMFKQDLLFSLVELLALPVLL